MFALPRSADTTRSIHAWQMARRSRSSRTNHAALEEHTKPQDRAHGLKIMLVIEVKGTNLVRIREVAAANDRQRYDHSMNAREVLALIPNVYGKSTLDPNKPAGVVRVSADSGLGNIGGHSRGTAQFE